MTARKRSKLLKYLATTCLVSEVRPPIWDSHEPDRLQRPSKDGSLRDFSRGALLEQHIIEVCQKAIADGRPIIGKIDQVIQNARVVASGIVVPDPSAKKTWCVILCEVHSISVVVREVRFDDIDLSIVQLLREGFFARKIGHVIELSPRTVEHRIERMKARAGVKSIVPLLIAKNLDSAS